MDNIIGFKGTIDDRSFIWNSMKIYKKAYRELLKDPSTRSIAINDLKRYKRMMSAYVS